MGKIFNFIKNKIGFLGAVTMAAIVGGVTAGVVMAAIPDSDGQITGCYRNNAGLTVPKGNLRVIDTTSEACTAQETQLSWTQHPSPEAYARLVLDSNTNLYGLDSDRSKNIVSLTDTTNGICMQVNFTPKNIQAGNIPSELLEVRDNSGWSGSNGSTICSGVTGANVFLASSTDPLFVLIK